ncbi:MAG: class I SAM-dependent methyltransferase [Firmicutes bacterium]|nr:class I SAM-dependent methyltransferase [Bacillota bacterium]
MRETGNLVLEHYFTNNQNLKSELRDIEFSLCDFNFKFKSDNGVFSKNKIDYASLFLVKTFLASNKKELNSILDIGCGYGFIGITASKILNKHVDMFDINKRAVHLAKMNVDINKVDATVEESDIYEKVVNKYDLIITNPPIRAGKSVLMDFLKGGLARLNKDGELWFVISKDQGAKSVKKEMEKICTCELVDKSKGFWVISAKN